MLMEVFEFVAAVGWAKAGGQSARSGAGASH